MRLAPGRLALACALLALGLAPARAHDTWLAPAAEQPGSGLLRLELVGGSRYPRREFSLAASGTGAGACREAGAGADAVLLPRTEHPTHLEMRARADAGKGVACWLEMRAWDVQIAADIVPLYFDEIRAPQAAQQRWAQLQARGVPWKESFRKFIRLELPPATGVLEGAALAELRAPRGLPMELVPVGGQPLRTGQPATFQVLFDGRPLAGQWVELVGERHPAGIWLQSDAQGQVRQVLPQPGPWLLRATALEPPAQDAQPWRSRFATLLVHVR